MPISPPTVSFAGISSGFDTKSIVKALIDIERVPLRRLEARKQLVLNRQNAYESLDTKMQALRDAAKALSDINDVLEFDAAVVDDTLFDASADSSATANSYNVTINQQATKSVLNGSLDIGNIIDPAAAMNGVNSLGSTLTGGTITVNGQQITVTATDSLNTLLTAIGAAIGGTASYNAGTDKVTISHGTNNIVLGSASDTSNVLDLLKLTSDGASTSVTSNSALGGLNMSAVLNAAGANGARAKTPVSDGGGGSGVFKVNGVSISFNASTDTMNNVLQRINDSTAGVLATYDKLTDRVVFTNKNDGATGISATDVTGNFVAAFGLGGAATLGKNAKITIAGINGGNPIESSDNIFTAAETGITGLSLTAKKSSGSTTVNVTTDTTKVSSKFQDFIDEYNSLVSFINSKTTPGSSDGSTPPGPLQNEQDVRIISRKLRGTLAAQVAGISSGPASLASIGVGTTAESAILSIDSTKLESSIINNASNVKAIVANTTDGIMNQIVSYIESQTNFSAGPLAEKSGNIDAQIDRMDESIERLKRNIDVKEAQMTAQFAAMERILAELQQGAATILGSLPQFQNGGG